MITQHVISPELAALACRLSNAEDGPTHPLWTPFAALFTAEMGRAPIPTDLYLCQTCPCHF